MRANYAFTSSMRSRPHLLFLSHVLPYPPDSGVTIRTFNVLKQLRKGFDVTVVMFSRRNHQPDALSRATGRRALQDLELDVGEASVIGSEYSLARLIWDHVRSLVTRRAYTFYQYRSATFRRQLREAFSRRTFGLVHLDSIDLHGILGDLPRLPRTCTHHDIESHALRQRAAHAGSHALRWYIRHQATLVQHTERSLCPTFAANLVMSDVDAQRLRVVAPTANTVVVPNGVDTTFFSPSGNGKATDRVVFVGNTYFPPNQDAVDYFLGDIWPQVRTRRPSTSFHIVGRGAPEDRARFSVHAGVTAHDHVPDVRPYLAEADCAVVPIRFGGGTRIKILDAWAMGRAVVSTSTGCEGLPALDGENILVRDTPPAFAEAVTEVLANAELRARLGERGRQTVEEFYSWDTVGARMRDLYTQLM